MRSDLTHKLINQCTNVAPRASLLATRDWTWFVLEAAGLEDGECNAHFLHILVSVAFSLIIILRFRSNRSKTNTDNGDVMTPV
jgi:hypothetical protein